MSAVEGFLWRNTAITLLHNQKQTTMLGNILIPAAVAHHEPLPSMNTSWFIMVVCPEQIMSLHNIMSIRLLITPMTWAAL